VAQPAPRSSSLPVHEPASYDGESARFEVDRHYYPRVLNAQIHPLVRYFMGLGNERIAERYCHLHPDVEPHSIREILDEPPKHFRWGGADLINATTVDGTRRMVVIETNSCPSGQKSMPFVREHDERAGYAELLKQAFLPRLKRKDIPHGGLCVLYDKNKMEASGYAAVLSELTHELVHLVPCFEGVADPSHRFTADGVLEIRVRGQWHPMRAALRYVTQRPWTRVPPVARTEILNPVLICLAGGRNKLLAAKAYDLYNAELRSAGLQIRTPDTIWDVPLEEVPLWVQRMSGYAVVKVPYSNAGQGVFTITNAMELASFMSKEHRYDRFVVQALIGKAGWSSRTLQGSLLHVGTVPDKKSHTYVFDLRFMIGAGEDGVFPVALYARRARVPLVTELDPGVSSWDMLGTNLSIKTGDHTWDTETDRLLLMDSRDFDRLGIGLDDLVEAYVQTTMALRAIDRMAESLLTRKGRFRLRYFRTINRDARLAKEIIS
jgi:hypothetical protein